MGRIRIVDVAREAGVSVGTVSNALNHPERVRPDTRRQIDEAVERLGYTPNQSARTLRGGGQRALGLILPRLNHGVLIQVVNGATTEARRHGMDLLVACAEDDADAQRLVDYFRGMQLAGVLVRPVDPAEWKPPARTQCPVVRLCAPAGGPGLYVAADDLARGRIIASHVAEQGAGRVAVLGAARDQAMLLRRQGVLEAAAEWPGTVFEVVDAGDGAASGDGFGLAGELMRRPPGKRPDTLVCLTDVLAAGAVAGLVAAGLEVPGDVAVAGCDGNPLAWGCPVPLTTCSPLGYEVGRRGVRMVLEELGEVASARGDAAAPADPATVDEPATLDVLDGLFAHPVPPGTGTREELVRPFLLQRASTTRQGAPAAGAGAHKVPELDMGAYL